MASPATSVLVYIQDFVKISVERLAGTEVVVVPSTRPDVTTGEGVVAADVTLDSSTGVYVRIYVPRPVTAALPVLVYIHGGAFCTQSAASPTYHNYLLKLVAKLNCVCVSVSYRLAPEHRLPAAYDDSFLALQWLRTQAVLSAKGSSDPWLTSSIADFSKCFLNGDSAGPNVINELGIRMGSDQTTWGKGSPLRIRGVVLVHPFFWGKERIEYEPNMDEETFQAFVTDTNNQWNLCLPEGEDYDYAFCNPVGPRGYPLLPTLLYSNLLVVIADLDPRRHRALLYRNAVFNLDGKKVSTFEQQGVDHDYHLQVSDDSSEDEKLKASEMMEAISDFIKDTISQ